MKSASLAEIGYTVPSQKNHHERLAHAVYHKMEKMVSEGGRDCAHDGGAGAGIDDGNGWASGKHRRMGSLSAGRDRARQRAGEEEEKQALRKYSLGCRMGVDATELEGGSDTQRDAVDIVVLERQAKVGVGECAAVGGMGMAGIGDSVARIETAGAVSGSGARVGGSESLGAGWSGDDVAGEASVGVATQYGRAADGDEPGSGESR
jgi:hypothetical protein